MSDGKEFLKEAKEVRNEFVKIAGQYSVSEHLELRTEIDTLLIMYDQACERVRVGSKPETSASTCNLQNVMAMLLPDINEFDTEAEQFAEGGFSTEDEKYAYTTAWQECRQWLVNRLKGN